jgi:hypothetical protein
MKRITHSYFVLKDFRKYEEMRKNSSQSHFLVSQSKLEKNGYNKVNDVIEFIM